MDYDEYRLWEIFWEKELERPRRGEFYLMGVMAETRRPHVKNPDQVKLEDMRIRFKDKKANPYEGMDSDMRTKAIKNRWFAAVGINPEDFGKEGQLSTSGPPKAVMRRKIRPNQ